ncbi:MAG: nuclear transport factor 2 family protein [Alphaproteobacteria bacterium]
MADSADIASIADWFRQWGALVSAVDFVPARALFDKDVVGFGTFQDQVHGQAALEAEQWRRVWPTIEDFAFDTGSLVAQVSPDRLMASAAILWTSTGIAEDGSRFPRPGRCTVALRRDAVDAPWKGIHTHFSLHRGVPQRSHGQRQPRS